MVGRKALVDFDLCTRHSCGQKEVADLLEEHVIYAYACCGGGVCAFVESHGKW